LIETYLKLDDEEEKRFDSIVSENTQYEEVSMVQSMTDVGIEIGIREGL
jgi:hypothetical protein